ncbi:SDR family oxidoreductase [Marinobacter orientalis]|uniref:SDR family oxidoreductase n=1 Tax=Marinobacter orientalis TaxID=1928859 RepID=A0A7Y0NL51_9GAMM|nr:SDR family oxidoreductase [Marinobacter orientalis]NMT63019.1 SDR family oxidoreductase [Marinobacter orientalis]TGX51682.1 SDR family oxidoreductase [Marinobacter orientalis]
MSNTNEPIDQKVVIITGASSGLGEATARRLAGRGARLVLAARREDRLKALTEDLKAEGAEVIWQTTDVTDRKQVEALAALAKDTFGRIDVLINNAGLMPLAPLHALKVDEWEQMVDVNIKGVMYGIAAVLPTMREQHSGHVINLSSVAGHKVFPGAAVYCATKYAVKALSEGLRMEAGDEIRSTNISPGAIATELTSTITDPDAKKSAEELYEVAIDADAVARAIVYAIEQPADVDINEIILRPTAQEL